MNKAAVQHRTLMIVLAIVLLAVAFPLYWMLLSSFNPRTVLFQPPYKFSASTFGGELQDLFLPRNF
jgi:ABC-type glycerol-3-phosphate transport system permease component